MQILNLSMSGMSAAVPKVAFGQDGQPRWVVAHGTAFGGHFGVSGEVAIAFASRDFPVGLTRVASAEGGCFLLECGHRVPVGYDSWMRPGHRYCCPRCNQPPSGHFQLRDQSRGGYLIFAADQDDGRQMLLWHLSPGYGGGAQFSMDGEVRLLAQGRVLFGNTTKGAAPAPIIQVRGPCHLHWQRSGQIGRTPARWEAIYDGAAWQIGRERQQRRATAHA